MSLLPVKKALDDIASMSSRIIKEKLATYALASVPWFKETVLAAYTQDISYNILDIEWLDGTKSDAQTIFNLLKILSSQSGASFNDRMALGMAASIDNETHEVVSRILNKDLRCGLGLKSWSKLLPDLTMHQPMLAEKDINKFLSHATGAFSAIRSTSLDLANVCWSVKIDGERCQASINGPYVTFTSRGGKNDMPVSHDHLIIHRLVLVGEQLDRLGFGRPHILDGEIVHKSGDFTKTAETMRSKSYNHELVYLVFDCPSISASFTMRYSVLKECLQSISGTKASLATINTRDAYLLTHTTLYEDPKKVALQIIDAGNEGIVLKTWNHLYQHKRSRDWCKIKKLYLDRRIDVDLPVIRIETGHGKFSTLVGALICNHNGKEVKVGSGLSDDQRVEFLLNPPKIIEVHAEEETADGSLRFPIFKRVREW